MTGDTGTLDALAAALQSLAEGLDQTIDDLYSAGADFAASQAENARDKIETAASKINDASATAKLSDDAFAKLKDFTTEINAKADAIAKDEQNVARITGIAAGVLTLAVDIAAFNVSAVITDVGNVQKILG